MSIDNVKALVRCSSHNGLLDGAVLLDKRCAFPKTRYRVREARHWRLETLRSAYEGEDSSLSKIRSPEESKDRKPPVAF
jgi:hypothetical protein